MRAFITFIVIIISLFSMLPQDPVLVDYLYVILLIMVILLFGFWFYLTGYSIGHMSADAKNEKTSEETNLAIKRTNKKIEETQKLLQTLQKQINITKDKN